MLSCFLNRRIYTCKVQCAQGASYDKSMPKIVIGNKDISIGVLVYFRTEFAILIRLKLICDIFTVFLKKPFENLFMKNISFQCFFKKNEMSASIYIFFKKMNYIFQSSYILLWQFWQPWQSYFKSFHQIWFMKKDIIPLLVSCLHSSPSIAALQVYFVFIIVTITILWEFISNLWLCK